MIDKIMDHPVFIALAALGCVDMVVQAITSGRVKLIHLFLAIIFGGGE